MLIWTLRDRILEKLFLQTCNKSRLNHHYWSLSNIRKWNIWSTLNIKKWNLNWTFQQDFSQYVASSSTAIRHTTYIQQVINSRQIHSMTCLKMPLPKIAITLLEIVRVSLLSVKYNHEILWQLCLAGSPSGLGDRGEILLFGKTSSGSCR